MSGYLLIIISLGFTRHSFKSNAELKLKTFHNRWAHALTSWGHASLHHYVWPDTALCMLPAASSTTTFINSTPTKPFTTARATSPSHEWLGKNGTRSKTPCVTGAAQSVHHLVCNELRVLPPQSELDTGKWLAAYWTGWIYVKPWSQARFTEAVTTSQLRCAWLKYVPANGTYFFNDDHCSISLFVLIPY